MGNVQSFNFKVFAKTFKWIYRKFSLWLEARRRKDDPLHIDYLREKQNVFVPSTACVLVLCLYIGLGSILFSQSENWEYLDSVYFCLTSLLKIGFGDLVPGSSEASGINFKLYMDYLYLLLGMGIVAMNFYLLKEDVIYKSRTIKEKCSKYVSKIINKK